MLAHPARHYTGECYSTASSGRPADPGRTASGLDGGHGHSVHDGTDAIIAFALAEPVGPPGTFAERDGELPGSRNPTRKGLRCI